MTASDADRIKELEAELASLRAASADGPSNALGLEAENPKIEVKRKPVSRRLIIVVVATIVAVIVVVGVLVALGANKTNPDRELLESAYTVCAESSDGITLKDDGTTLIFDHKGEEDSSGASIDDIVCVLMLLDIPSSIVSHMDQTTSLDGRQVEEWNNFQIQWSYHPNRGMDGIVTVVQD